MAQERMKVFIVDDHEGTREGLRKLLEFENTFRVCGEAGAIDQAVAGIIQTDADVAVVDLDLGQQTGLDLIDRLNGAYRKIPILILSMHPETLYAEKSLQCGARGYLMKSESPDRILLALREVAFGKTYLSPTMTKKLQTREETRHE